MGSTLFRDPRALSNPLATLGLLQHQANKLHRSLRLSIYSFVNIYCICIATHLTTTLTGSVVRENA